ncbi:NUDIX domain-containing protein [Streptomyces venezuelae]|uniref:NUDIX hydrolase n=1 Tax=Streptomyces venezuelae TaxID=54571 RepID=UPI00342297C7
MAITADHIRTTLTSYLARHPDDLPALDAVRGLINDGNDLAHRATLPGHATAGAILVDAAHRVLRIRHIATGKWLLPGGHLEPCDDTLLQAAGRELTEETGIPPHLITPHSETPLHIDVHPIDANRSKGEPAHQHYDFRFLFRTAGDTETLLSISNLQTEEVSAAAWHDITQITDPVLRQRITTALS